MNLFRFLSQYVNENNCLLTNSFEEKRSKTLGLRTLSRDSTFIMSHLLFYLHIRGIFSRVLSYENLNPQFKSNHLIDYNNGVQFHSFSQLKVLHVVTCLHIAQFAHLKKFFCRIFAIFSCFTCSLAFISYQFTVKVKNAGHDKQTKQKINFNEFSPS